MASLIGLRPFTSATLSWCEVGVVREKQPTVSCWKPANRKRSWKHVLNNWLIFGDGWEEGILQGSLGSLNFPLFFIVSQAYIGLCSSTFAFHMSPCLHSFVACVCSNWIHSSMIVGCLLSPLRIKQGKQDGSSSGRHYFPAKSLGQVLSIPQHRADSVWTCFGFLKDKISSTSTSHHSDINYFQHMLVRSPVCSSGSPSRQSWSKSISVSSLFQ